MDWMAKRLPTKPRIPGSSLGTALPLFFPCRKNILYSKNIFYSIPNHGGISETHPLIYQMKRQDNTFEDYLSIWALYRFLIVSSWLCHVYNAVNKRVLTSFAISIIGIVIYVISIHAFFIQSHLSMFV